MKPYIENREGVKYEFTPLTRRQRINIQSDIEKLTETKDIQMIENLVYKVLKFEHTELTKEQFDDMLDFNVEEYGFNETYEMLGYIIEDVFTQVGGETSKKENPYLQSKRVAHQN